MTRPELAHLGMLAEVDTLVERLTQWAENAPPWRPAGSCRALVRRLLERMGTIRVRLEAPLIVATLGGTGTGKSALVNALLGSEVVASGRERPTTTRPTLLCRPGLTPDILGIDPEQVHLIQRDLPALAGLVLIDCPDPDTTEETASAQSNLARLRNLLPHCDVLLITTTQQKYRSARVADELASAASGAHLIFVQTHAQLDQDIRDDWRAMLESRYAPGRIFLVDSLTALADARDGREPRGEFAALMDLLTRKLSGTAAARIRRANLLDLVEEALMLCAQQVETGMEGISALEASMEKQRARLAATMAHQMRGELLGSRRSWENRLLGQVASRWGLSPFSMVLRLYQGLGSLLAGSLLLRVRTPAQMALWGTMQGARAWRKHREARQADTGADRAIAQCWPPAELRSAAMIVDGYAGEAGLEGRVADPETVADEAAEAGTAFVRRVSGELETLVDRLARRHSGWFTRWRYELLLCAMLGVLLYRLGKNFFYDSWLAPHPGSVYGLDFYVSAGFWLLLWCLFLLWAFTGRLRRGLRREIDQIAQSWTAPQAAEGVFARLGRHCRDVEAFRQELDRLREHVHQLRRRLALPDQQLGRRR